mmetsp:Transcript_14814/g.22068  ORF Transcript_14814/g.22068 Transcript_14814/m.22068 type:complete len:85 (-) Transcript_14814:17-271(-)
MFTPLASSMKLRTPVVTEQCLQRRIQITPTTLYPVIPGKMETVTRTRSTSRKHPQNGKAMMIERAYNTAHPRQDFLSLNHFKSC